MLTGIGINANPTDTYISIAFMSLRTEGMHTFYTKY